MPPTCTYLGSIYLVHFVFKNRKGIYKENCTPTLLFLRFADEIPNASNSFIPRCCCITSQRSYIRCTGAMGRLRSCLLCLGAGHGTKFIKLCFCKLGKVPSRGKSLSVRQFSMNEKKSCPRHGGTDQKGGNVYHIYLARVESSRRVCSIDLEAGHWWRLDRKYN